MQAQFIGLLSEAFRGAVCVCFAENRLCKMNFLNLLTANFCKGWLLYYEN